MAGCAPCPSPSSGRTRSSAPPSPSSCAVSRRPAPSSPPSPPPFPRPRGPNATGIIASAGCGTPISSSPPSIAWGPPAPWKSTWATSPISSGRARTAACGPAMASPAALISRSASPPPWRATGGWGRCGSATRPISRCRTTSMAASSLPPPMPSSTGACPWPGTRSCSSAWRNWGGWRWRSSISRMPVPGNCVTCPPCIPFRQSSAGRVATGWRASPPAWGWRSAPVTGAGRPIACTRRSVIRPGTRTWAASSPPSAVITWTPACCC